jgi:hypothetical protein
VINQTPQLGLTERMSEEETKKWHIERVETVLETRIQKLEAERKQIRSQSELVENEVTTWSKRLFTGASFAAPLILALYSVEPWRNFVLPLLATDIAIGLLMFRKYNSIRGEIHNLILSTDTAFLLAIEKLNYFRAYFDMDTYFLDKITENKIASFYNYNDFASVAAQVELIENFENMIKSKYFDKMKNDLQVRLSDREEPMNYGMQAYEQEKPSWDRDRIEWKMLRFVHEDFFKYHGYKIDEKTGEIAK